MVNVGRYTIHGWYGIYMMNCFNPKTFCMTLFFLVDVYLKKTCTPKQTGSRSMFMNTGAVVVLGGNDIEVKQYSNPY